MIDIRPAKIDEWGNIRELNKRICIDISDFDEDLVLEFADTPEAEKIFKDQIGNTDGVCLVAELDGQLIGYVSGGRKVIEYRKGVYFEIDNLGVVPESKGQGVGRMLVESVTNWAKENGYTKIYVESYVKNIDAINFYRKNGFADIDLSLEKHI